jgi:hypothetical protein
MQRFLISIFALLLLVLPAKACNNFVVNRCGTVSFASVAIAPTVAILPSTIATTQIVQAAPVQQLTQVQAVSQVAPVCQAQLVAAAPVTQVAVSPAVVSAPVFVSPAPVILSSTFASIVPNVFVSHVAHVGIGARVGLFGGGGGLFGGGLLGGILHRGGVAPHVIRTHTVTRIR